MIQDKEMMQAVSQILQRSDKQEDLQKLLHTFVDVGVLPQLLNRNNQILYGRRGTGKTHAFRVLAERLREDPKSTVVYIDARTLGSTSQFADVSAPLPRRCLALFRDILLELHAGLLQHAVYFPGRDSNGALAALDVLASAVSEDPVAIPKTVRTSEEAEASASRGRVLTAAIPYSAGANVSSGSGSRATAGREVEYAVQAADRIFFPDLHKALKNALTLAETDLHILIDEWSSLPEDVQPYLAEFLKRGVFPLQMAVVKIACLEHRSRFELLEGGRRIGFELGADISTTADLDDYYVFDRNPDAISRAYSDMLFRHLAAGLPEKHLERHYKVKDGNDLASRMFTEKATFEELARAAEGVVRDLINIFNKAFFDSHRRGRDSIDRKAVMEAARHWFEQDKSQHLDGDMQAALRRLVDDVIGKKRARSFLLPRNLERHPVIQRLFDARVLHHMQRGYADKDNPGLRYNVYTLDYGTYVDLLTTKSQPDLEMGSQSGKDFVVPFDDKRSIRRIVLTEEILGTAL